MIWIALGTSWWPEARKSILTFWTNCPKSVKIDQWTKLKSVKVQNGCSQQGMWSVCNVGMYLREILRFYVLLTFFWALCGDSGNDKNRDHHYRLRTTEWYFWVLINAARKLGKAAYCREFWTQTSLFLEISFCSISLQFVPVQRIKRCALGSLQNQ